MALACHVYHAVRVYNGISCCRRCLYKVEGVVWVKLDYVT